MLRVKGVNPTVFMSLQVSRELKSFVQEYPRMNVLNKNLNKVRVILILKKVVYCCCITYIQNAFTNEWSKLLIGYKCETLAYQQIIHMPWSTKGNHRRPCGDIVTSASQYPCDTQLRTRPVRVTKSFKSLSLLSFYPCHQG